MGICSIKNDGPVLSDDAVGQIGGRNTIASTYATGYNQLLWKNFKWNNTGSVIPLHNPSHSPKNVTVALVLRNLDMAELAIVLFRRKTAPNSTMATVSPRRCEGDCRIGLRRVTASILAVLFGQ